MSTTMLERPEGRPCEEADPLDAYLPIFDESPAVLARVDDDDDDLEDDDEVEDDGVEELDDDFPKHGEDDELEEDDLDDDE